MCPEFWAKLEFGTREVEPTDLFEQILRWKPVADGGNPKPALRVKICGDEIFIKYHEKHMLRLQALVKASNSDGKNALVDSSINLNSANTPSANILENLVRCPYCECKVSPQNLEKHKSKKCPQGPNISSSN